MNSLKTSSTIIIVLLSVMTSSTAQQETVTPQVGQEKVILYNSQPIKVELVGDKIKSFIGEVPKEFMAGYDLVEKEAINIASLPALESKSVDGQTVNADYAILLNQKFHLNFKPGFATLDKAMINKLNDIAQELKSDNTKRVLLTTHLSDDSTKAEKLADNRLGAATAYLKIKGISLARIQTESQSGSGLFDLVAVNFLQ